MGMILDYIEQAGKGKYQCFKTKKICLDSVDNDTIANNNTFSITIYLFDFLRPS